MFLLILAAALWVFVHVGISGTALRGRAIAAVGEKAFMIGFSLASVVSITLLVLAWQNAPTTPLWSAGSGLRWVLAVLMLPALVLFMTSHKRNPTAVGNKGLGEEPRGIQRITRHPMLWSFALWGLVHLIGKGSLGGVFFFGAFLVTALVGMPSIDHKVAARDPGMWARLAASTSILPFKAIVAGRNRLLLAEVPVFVWVVGLLAWLGFLIFHQYIFGYPAIRV